MKGDYYSFLTVLAKESSIFLYFFFIGCSELFHLRLELKMYSRFCFLFLLNITLQE